MNINSSNHNNMWLSIRERIGLWFGKNLKIPVISKFLVDLADTSLVLGRAFIVMSVFPMYLFMLFVESQRVYHGVLLFESEYPQMAAIAAICIVIANGVIEVIAHYMEDVAGYERPQNKRFSFGLVADHIQYVLPFGPWKKHREADGSLNVIYKSPAEHYHRISMWTSVTIFVLALLGSLSNQLERVENMPWTEGLREIFVNSNAEQMLTIIGGLVFTVALVFLTRVLSKYISTRAMEFVGEQIDVHGAPDENNSPASNLQTMVSVIESRDEDNNMPVVVGKASANLVELKWAWGGSDKEYGPYSTRNQMLGAMRNVLSRQQ